MTRDDLRLFCTALGFTAVVIRPDARNGESAARATGFAQQIEAFCLHALPHLAAPANQDGPPPVDEEIEHIKHELRTDGLADFHKNRDELLRLHDRLWRRYMTFASDDMIADRVLALVDAEIDHEERGSGSV